jgi:hypothetical protein
MPRSQPTQTVWVIFQTSSSGNRMDEKCESCGRDSPIVRTQWSLLWETYLCHDCRMKRVDLEVRKTVKSEIRDGKVVIINGTS